MKNPDSTLLEQIYKEGTFAIPTQGRYKIYVYLQKQWVNILEKSIELTDSGLKGNNHLPIFLARYKNVPYMDFEVVPNRRTNEIWLVYKNGVIIDALKYIKKFDAWLGKLYWEGRFVFYFWFIPNYQKTEVNVLMEKIKKDGEV